MRKVLMFFLGVLLLLLTFTTVYFSGALYNAGAKKNINAFIFQPNNLSSDRINQPIPMDKMSDSIIRDKLITKFVTEYFYVSPNPEDIEQRKSPASILAAMSAPNVFKEWKTNMAEPLDLLAQKKVLRRVIVGDIILPENSKYWAVYYDLYTWDIPNKMEITPTKESGVLYLNVDFENGVREQRGGKHFDVNQYLENGGDPAAIFKFRVNEARK